VGAAVWAPLGVLGGAAAWYLPLVEASRARRRHEERLLADLPEVVDLLGLAVGAGLTVPMAVAVVARRAPGEVGAALRHVAAAIALGRRAADALDDLPAVAGEAVRPVTAALAASDRYGIPLGPTLAVLSVEVRADRRRRAEAAARRVPVKLLFPLVLCVLPAFGLLTVVPLLAGAATSLDF
jgi:tight adherence protein C